VLQVAATPDHQRLDGARRSPGNRHRGSGGAARRREERGVSEVVESERIVELPLQGRDVTSLLVLAGASVNTAVRTAAASLAGSMSRRRRIAVRRGYLLDGACTTIRRTTRTAAPFPDAVQEFRVATTGLTAQNGMHSGASVNAITKSGTNRFSGTVRVQPRPAFQSTDPFARVVNGKRVTMGCP
jgi:hypothetical protein